MLERTLDLVRRYPSTSAVVTVLMVFAWTPLGGLLWTSLGIALCLFLVSRLERVSSSHPQQVEEDTDPEPSGAEEIDDSGNQPSQDASEIDELNDLFNQPSANK
jgi:hypothetical protein